MAYSNPPSSNQIRIREGTVTELNIPKEVLEVLEKIVSSPHKADDYKKLQIKKLTGGSPCCLCRDGIPAFQISYPFHEGGATRIERYCSKCIERVYSREQVL